MEDSSDPKKLLSHKELSRVTTKIAAAEKLTSAILVVALNREVFLGRPLVLLRVAAIAVASTFLLSFAIEVVARIFRADPRTVVTLVLVGTLKNYGLAAGLALALFSKKAAVPATVSTIFMIVYIIWLGFKRRWR